MFENFRAYADIQWTDFKSGSLRCQRMGDIPVTGDAFDNIAVDADLYGADGIKLG